jgi:hypothetical protein
MYPARIRRKQWRDIDFRSRGKDVFVVVFWPLAVVVDADTPIVDDDEKDDDSV